MQVDATNSFWKDSEDLMYSSLSRSTYVCMCSESQSSKLVGIVPIQRDFRVALLLILSSFSDFAIVIVVSLLVVILVASSLETLNWLHLLTWNSK